MQTIVILGAGQFGRACAPLLNTSYYQLLAYGDNSPKLQGTFIENIPVLPISEAIACQPDCALIGLTDSDRTKALEQQARSYGFQGTILFLRDLYQLLDIRSATLWRMAKRIQEQSIPGNIAELGVYKGDLAWKLNLLFPDRSLYLFDTFEGFDKRDVEQESAHSFSRAQKGDFSDTDKSAVLARLPYPDKAVIRKGFFPDTANGLEEISYAFVSLDADLYAPILAGLHYFYPRLHQGGTLLLHDYNNPRFRGAHQAVEDYEKEKGHLLLVPLCDLHGSAVIMKP
ncbi:MAG: class I SAM-dependent methyltransferase [Clostridiales bacterium]|nr:class I SAM-dependent methyltransferase [Clostridiales bacterium]